MSRPAPRSLPVPTGSGRRNRRNDIRSRPALGPRPEALEGRIVLDSRQISTITLVIGQAVETFGQGVVLPGQGGIQIQPGQSLSFSATVRSNLNLVEGSPVLNAGPKVGAAASDRDVVAFFDGTTPIATQDIALRSIAGGGPDVGIGAEGTAVFSTSGLAPGVHLVHAVFNGDLFNRPATSSDVEVVVGDVPTTVRATPTQGTITYGQHPGLDFAVDAGGGKAPSGFVNVYDGTTLIDTHPSNQGPGGLTGEYVISTPLSAGHHTLTVKYVDNQALLTATTTVAVDVVPASTYTILTGSAPSASFGQPVTYTAAVYPFAPGVGTPTGTMTFYDGVTPLGAATLVGGQARLTVPATGVGQAHWVTAVYSGDADFGRDSSPIRFETVTRAFVSVVPAERVSAFGVTLPTTVVPATPGAATPTGTLTLLVDGRSVATEPLTAGASSSFFLSRYFAQDRVLTILYSGDVDYAPAASAPIFAPSQLWSGPAGATPPSGFRFGQGPLL